MVSFPSIESRLEHVRVTCGYPSQAALMEAIGRKPAQWGSWVQRNNYGRDGDTLLKEVTGVSIDWLKSGKGEPFPNGPILFLGAQAASPGLADRLARIEADVDALGGVLAAVIKAVGRLAPPEAAAIASALGTAVRGRPNAPALLQELADVAQRAAAAPSGAGAPKPRKR